MKAILFTKKDTAELVETEMPQLSPGKVLVKLMVSTISSGTERANLTGELNISRNPADCLEAHWPRQCGYSSSGIVQAIGDGVTTVTPGDHVALSWSSHQQYVALDEKNVHKIEDDRVSMEEAALWHIGTFPIGAIRKCRLEFGESAIVMGQGVLGMFAVRILRAAGAAPIIAVDPVPEKRAQALKIGADYAFDPNEPDFAEQVKQVTHGGVKVAIEVTGVGKALDQVLDCMAPFGRIALLGCTRDSDFSIDYYHKVHGPGITMIGAHTIARPAFESSNGWWTEQDDVRAEMELYRFGRLTLGDLIEETHSPEDAPEVYKRLATENTFPLVQFDWRML